MAVANIVTSSSDGQIIATDPTYTTAQGATTGTVTDGSTPNAINNEFITPNFRVTRIFYFFDLSSIPSGATVDSVTLDIYPTNRDTTTDDNVQVVSSTANDPLQAGDFDLVGSTGYVDSPPAYSALTLNATNTLTFNATGIASVQSALGGAYKCALRPSKDISVTNPGSNRSFVQIAAQEDATASHRPTLNITYTPSFIPRLNIT